VLEANQIRRLLFLAGLFVISVALLYRYINLGPRPRPAPAPAAESAREPSKVPDDAPPPPPSPFPPGSSVLDGALRETKDFTHPKELDTEKPYRALVSHVLSLSDEALRSSSEGEIAYDTYRKYAPELRGRAFRVTGWAVDKVEPMRLTDPIAGKEDIYRLYLTDFEEGGFVVDLVERPPLIEKQDNVKIDGIFLKVSRYEGKYGQFRDAPVLVARTFERVFSEPTKENSTWFLIKLCVVAGIAATLAIAYVLFRKMSAVRYPRPGRRNHQGPPKN
jgi:hypothetical protein